MNYKFRTYALEAGCAGIFGVGSLITGVTEDSTEKTTRRGLSPEYMGVVAPQPPPYIPAGTCMLAFCSRVTHNSTTFGGIDG